MREGNTNVRYSFTSMLDSVSELFGGRLSIQDILNMDMSMMRSMVKSRLDNLNKHKAPSTNTELDKLIKKFSA